MAQTTVLSGLSPREAVADALHRCVLGLDTNDRDLVETAFVKDESTVMSIPSHDFQGWSQINQLVDAVFRLNTTHYVTNIRVDLKDPVAATTASMTAHAIAYHVRPETAFAVENTSYTAGNLYFLDLVKDEVDGELWKITKWVIQNNWTYGDRAVVTR